MQTPDQLSEKEMWDERYKNGLPSLEIPDPFFEEIFRKYLHGSAQKSMKALDLAAGPGRHSLYLAGHGWNVTAVDISPVAIDKLKKSAADRRLAVASLTCDLENYELAEEAFDLIVLYYYFDRNLFPRILRSLKPGGMLICKLAVSLEGKDYLTAGGVLPLQPAELKELLAGLDPLYCHERPIKHRAVTEYAGIKPSSE